MNFIENILFVKIFLCVYNSLSRIRSGEAIGKSFDLEMQAGKELFSH